MRNMETVAIDKDKFMAAIENAGETMLSAGFKIGHAQGYFSKRLSRYQSITLTDAIALEASTGIKREQYEIVEEKTEKEAPAPEPTKIEIDYDKLQKTIYEAVYGALINADKVIRESR